MGDSMINHVINNINLEKKELVEYILFLRILFIAKDLLEYI
jgi:hypothetical protein